MSSKPTEIELLAPARNADIAIEAIRHGADAVYIGPPSHGARRAASNSIDDIKRATDFAHIYGARVYATVNTLIYDAEMHAVLEQINDLYAAGVDALIVQDLGLLMQHLPPIALHASTQCDIRTPQRARFLQDAGFTQLVLPRELTIDEIAAMRQAVSVPLEAFVHGALCVSYSGDCQASFVATGRSANRGECAQICRYRFNLEDDKGSRIVEGKHLLSLRDLNRLDALPEMLHAGITSFKIEGRLKDADYVKNIVAAYSRRLNEIIANDAGRWRRASRGQARYNFTPDVNRSFNRGFTPYFLHKPEVATKMAAISTPKFVGERIGVVRRVLSPSLLEVKLQQPVANGDGLGFFGTDGTLAGFRVNRTEGKRIYPASPLKGIAAGTELYRNADKRWADLLQRTDSAHRQIEVAAHLRIAGQQLSLRFTDTNGIFAEATATTDMPQARTPQQETRRRIIEKLGDTPLVLRNLTDEAGSVFIAASVLTELRRRVAEQLVATYRLRHDYRRRSIAGLRPRIPAYPESEPRPSRHLNIANAASETFYLEAMHIDGHSHLPHAIEVETTHEKEIRVMQTRYCLRRELGACLRTPTASRLPRSLWLTSGNLRLRLEFDCPNCRMNIYTVKMQ